ncbi:MAG: DUF4422 domain-containing protein [Selenomonas sp.]|nr:DUF4422 domain-containing protein [Selenomonas sp.]
MSKLILYGRGLIAEEYCRYLEAQGRGEDIKAFAVTKMNGQGNTYCSRPCIEIKDAIEKYPEAEVHLSLQEKYHQEVLTLLKELGREPKEIIGLQRMTELLGEQGIKQISEACPELIVQRNPHDYSMLEIFSKERPKEKFTFYPMTQVPLSEEALGRIRDYVQEHLLYIALATSKKDAEVRKDNLPDYLHPVLGGAADLDGKQVGLIEYDDAEAGNISRYNHLYSELTVAYWLWQKAPKAKYLGLCHYRRHFVLTEEVKEAMARGTVDVLLTTPRLTFPTVHKYFANLPVTTMDELDYETMLRFIASEDSEIAKYSRDFFEGQIHYPNNMLIARRDIYLDYCRFMFRVLQSMQEHYEREGIARPERYLGYVGELLTTVYFAFHRGKYRTTCIDYKLLKEI